MGYILQTQDTYDSVKNNIAMSNTAISVIESYLSSTDVLYEYGSGGSTLWFAPLIKKLYSVEHDTSWYNKIKDLVHDNTKLNLVPIHDPIDFDKITDEFVKELMGDAYPGGTTKTHWQRYSNYIRSIESVTEPIDKLIVDGRHRALCAYHAYEFIKKDAIVIFDDWNRSAYHGVLKFYDIIEVINKFDKSTGRPEFELYPNGSSHNKMTAILRKKSL